MTTTNTGETALGRPEAPGPGATEAQRAAYTTALDAYFTALEARWAAVPVQTIRRLEVEELVVRPKGSTITIRLGGSLPWGDGLAQLQVCDARGRAMLTIAADDDSVGLHLLDYRPEATGDEDEEPHYRASLDLHRQGDVSLRLYDSEGNIVFGGHGSSWDPYPDTDADYFVPKPDDTPERARFKAEHRAWVTRHQAAIARGRAGARAYHEAEGPPRPRARRRPARRKATP